MCFGMFLGEGQIGINEKGCVPNVSWEGKIGINEQVNVPNVF